MQKKITYLFGAGATHAEIINCADIIVSKENTNPEEVTDGVFKANNGLLISDVSKRVMRIAQQNVWFKSNEEIFTSAKGSLNIELLISLFEINRIEDDHINHLKKLVENDIKKILSVERKKEFYLHKAFFELHMKITDSEKLLGVISLNYDDVLDEAYKEILGNDPDYCFTSKRAGENIMPLLKLHGSFNWQDIEIYRNTKSIPIIPIGINKNYLAPPYNFIWGHAFELLVECDILRIIGCSLSQNDIGLIDLLFKAHLERNKSIEIQIIDFQPKNDHHSIKNNYGFFGNIIEPTKIEETLINDELIYDHDVGNPFKIWLFAKSSKMLTHRIDSTNYLKKLLN